MKSETRKLQPGQSRQVQVTELATQDQISAHQSADGDCKAKATIVDVFGDPV